MTIDELRAERKKTEDAIHTLLSEFKTKTGVCPIGVNVQVLSVERFAKPDEKYLGNVSIHLENI